MRYCVATPKQITAEARRKLSDVLAMKLKRRFSEATQPTLRMFDYKDVFKPEGSDESFSERATLVKTMMIEWDIPNYVADMLAKSLFWRADFRRWLKQSVMTQNSIRDNMKTLKTLLVRKRTPAVKKRLNMAKLAIRQDSESVRELGKYKEEVARKTKLYMPHFIYGGLLERSKGF